MKVIAIVGPTAVGKTALAIKLAKEIAQFEDKSVDALKKYL